MIRTIMGRSVTMALNDTEKNTIVERLQAAHRAAQKLELKLRFKGDAKTADRVWEGSKRLSNEIDILIGRAMEDWAGNAKDVVTKIQAQQAEIDGAIRDIKANIDTAKKVVAAVGALDDLVALATKLASAF